MKKVIKKILKSRVKRDEDFKDKNIVLSKRSYKYFEFIGNKLFKKLLSTSISNRINANEKEVIVDQQDLLASMSLLIPFGKFLEYSTFNAIGDKEKEREKEKEKKEFEFQKKLANITTTTTTTTTTSTKKKKTTKIEKEKKPKVEKVKKPKTTTPTKKLEGVDNNNEKEVVVVVVPTDIKVVVGDDLFQKDISLLSTTDKTADENKVEEKVSNDQTIENKVTEDKVAESKPVLEENVATTDKAAEENKELKDKVVTEVAESKPVEEKIIQQPQQVEEEEEDKLFFSGSYIKKLIKEQNYIGEYKFTKCFIKSIGSLLNYILVELMDCCLNHIYSINKRKNIIDLEDLLITINQDDDLRIVMNKLTNGIFEDRFDSREYLIDINKSLKGDQKKFNKEVIYNNLQKNFKLIESNRSNKPISIISKISNDNNAIEKINYSLTKRNKVMVKITKKPINETTTTTTTTTTNNNNNKKRERPIEEVEEFTQEYLQSLKVEDLKDIAKPIGLKYSGNKASIIQRLLEYFSGDKEIHSKTITNVIKKVSKKGEVSFIPQSHLVRVEVLKETKQIILPNKDSIYFELENLDDINQDEINNDEHIDDDNDNDHSFIDGIYSDAEDESEIDQNDETLDENVKDIYNYDFNKFYKDQLNSLSSGNDDQKYKRLLNKSPRWLWKNKSKLELTKALQPIDQYKLPPNNNEKEVEEEQEDDEESEDDQDIATSKKDSDKEYESNDDDDDESSESEMGDD